MSPAEKLLLRTLGAVALFAFAGVLLVGCGTTGRTFLKDAPNASYIMITEGEVQGSLTNTEVKDLPFTEFSYTETGCVLRALRPDTAQ